MDEESYSTSQDSFNSREAVRINTNPLFEIHCALCETIYSPGREANRHLNVCEDCKVRLLRESRQRDEEILRNLEENRREEELRQRVEQGLIEAWSILEETWPDLEENRRNLEETQRDSEEFRQRFEPHQQHVEQIRIEAWRDLEDTWWDLEDTWRNFEDTWPDLEENRRNLEETQQDSEEFQQDLEDTWPDLEETWPDLEENRRNLEETQQDSEEFWWNLEETQRHLEEFRQHFEPHRQLVERRLECLPRLVITEEHEKKHNGLECSICLDPLSVGSIVNQLPCLHFFHPLCIVPWLKVRMSCPTCRYKLSSAFHNETRQNSNRRIGFQEIVHEGSNVNSSLATYGVNEPEVVVSESYTETTDSSVRDREGNRGGWFLFAASPIVSLVGIALVECFQNYLGDGRGRGSTGHVKFPLQCQQQVRMFSSGSSSTRTSNSRENN